MKTKILFTLIFIANFAISQIPNWVPQSGLEGYWPLDSHANDVVNSYTSQTQLITSGQDRFGNPNGCFEFNGGNIITNYYGVSGQQARTFSFWYKSDTLSGGLLYYGVTQPGQRVNIYLYPTQLGNLMTIDNSNSQIAFSPYLQPGQWNHIVFTFDPIFGSETSQFELWVNGQLSQTEVINYNGSQVLNTAVGDPVQFGSVAGQPLFGKMDDIGIWSRALNVCEIKDLYHSQLNSGDITAPNDQTVCFEDWVTLTAQGSTTYSWSSGVLDSVPFQVYETSTYIVTGIDGSGCQGFDTVEIVVGKPEYTVLNVTANQSYLWSPSGQLLTVSGVYYDTLVNVNGCDSILQLNLTIELESLSLQDISQDSDKIVKVTDINGREINIQKNQLLIIYYLSGKIKKVYIIE